MKKPLRLKKNPIVEALFELRFQKKDIPPPEILPGIFFSEVKNYFKLSRIERLIPAIPEDILDKDENLKYLPQVKIRGERFGILIADSAVSLSYFPPYEGWDIFKDAISEFLSVLEKQKDAIFSSYLRFSLKYLNLFEEISEITALKITLRIGEYDIVNERCSLLAEIPLGSDVLIFNVNSSAKVYLEDLSKAGLLLSLDVIRFLKEVNSEEVFDFIRESLDELHDKEKDWFFSSLREETLEKLEPEYE